MEICQRYYPGINLNTINALMVSCDVDNCGLVKYVCLICTHVHRNDVFCFV